MIKLFILSENNAEPPYQAEHGLSLLIKANDRKLLFDTGAGAVLPENALRMNVELSSIDGVILSHGHRDHTGGLFHIPPTKLWCTPEILQPHFSHHPGKPVKDLTMPENCKEVLKQCNVEEINSFTEILPGVFLTGPIPRISGEDCGGPFYSDLLGNQKDFISDEQALLLKSGILIQGCCHAGVINTMEYCRKEYPGIKIHTIVGGLHLLLASEQRMKQTAEYLRNSEIKTLYLLHCTGINAVEYLKKQLPEIEIHTPCVNGKELLFQ